MLQKKTGVLLKGASGTHLLYHHRAVTPGDRSLHAAEARPDLTVDHFGPRRNRLKNHNPTHAHTHTIQTKTNADSK